VAAPAISAKDRIAMSAEATRHLAVGFLLIWTASERLIGATDDERQTRKRRLLKGPRELRDVRAKR
jgi:hypothetical protein